MLFLHLLNINGSELEPLNEDGTRFRTLSMHPSNFDAPRGTGKKSGRTVSSSRRAGQQVKPMTSAQALRRSNSQVSEIRKIISSARAENRSKMDAISTPQPLKRVSIAMVDSSDLPVKGQDSTEAIKRIVGDCVAALAGFLGVEKGVTFSNESTRGHRAEDRKSMLTPFMDGVKGLEAFFTEYTNVDQEQYLPTDVMYALSGYARDALVGMADVVLHYGGDTGKVKTRGIIDAATPDPYYQELSTTLEEVLKTRAAEVRTIMQMFHQLIGTVSELDMTLAEFMESIPDMAQAEFETWVNDYKIVPEDGELHTLYKLFADKEVLGPTKAKVMLGSLGVVKRALGKGLGTVVFGEEFSLKDVLATSMVNDMSFETKVRGGCFSSRTERETFVKKGVEKDHKLSSTESVTLRDQIKSFIGKK